MSGQSMRCSASMWNGCSWRKAKRNRTPQAQHKAIIQFFFFSNVFKNNKKKKEERKNSHTDAIQVHKTIIAALRLRTTTVVCAMCIGQKVEENKNIYGCELRVGASGSVINEISVAPANTYEHYYSRMHWCTDASVRRGDWDFFSQFHWAIVPLFFFCGRYWFGWRRFCVR